MGTLSVTREQAIAYRLDAHHLARRQPADRLLEAAGACGIQDSPPGAAALALHARLEGLTPDAIRRAQAEEKSLLQTMSLRGAAYQFPTADAAVFTTGALPETEEELRFFVQGAAAGLEAVGMSFTELVARCDDALREVLDRQQMTKDPLGRALGTHVAAALPPDQADAWMQPSSIIKGQFLGETLARFAIYVLGLRGRFCFVPRSTEAAEFARAEQWLGHPLPRVGQDPARAELARRYLRCYAPSTLEDFAAWAGISPAQAARGWSRIEPELLPVHFARRPAFLLAAELERLRQPQPAEGVRLLPPHDPYLLLRDRATLLADRARQRMVWRTVGNPGALLVNGDFQGIWRAQKRGKRLEMTLQPFAPLTPEVKQQIEAEAESLLPFKGSTSLAVSYAGLA